MFVINDHDEKYIIKFISDIYADLVLIWIHNSEGISDKISSVNSQLYRRKYKQLPRLLAKNVDIRCIGRKAEQDVPLIIWQPLLIPEN